MTIQKRLALAMYGTMKSRGMTMHNVADATGISYRTIRRVMAGESVTLNTLDEVAHALGLKIECVKGRT
jgi:transcriptional regulator with XRE-family HTH domain